MANVSTVITARHLTHSFGSGEARVVALRDVSVGIRHNQWTSIMGRSGSGKTTLLHCLSGLTVPDQGEVLLHSGQRRRPAQRSGRRKHSPRKKKRAETAAVNISRLSEDDRCRLRRTRIGVVFQDFNLVPVLNTWDNIALPMRLAHRRIDANWREEILNRLGLDARLKHLPHELSGGQQQRVAIARALLAKPDIIFADEPTGNLDSETTAEVLRLFRMIVSEFGQTLVMVTHDADAARHSDHIITMKDGHLSREDPQ